MRRQGKAIFLNNLSRNIALWVVIALLVLALFNLFQSPSTRGPSASLPYSQFLQELENGAIRDVTIQGSTITGHYTSSGAFNT